VNLDDLDDVDDDLGDDPAIDVTLTPDQRQALDQIMSWLGRDGQQTLALTGPAGSGKSTLLKALQHQLQRRGRDATWCATTGKAAVRLARVTGQAATLHSTLYGPPKEVKGKLRFDDLKPEPDTDVVVIDEASMLTPTLFHDVQTWSQHLLFVGDGMQLPPVLDPDDESKHGKTYSVFDHVTGPELTTIVRSNDEVIDIATELRTKHKIPRKAVTTVRDPMTAAVEAYLADPDDHMLITWRNEARMAANRLVRQRRGIEDPMLQADEPFLVRKNSRTAMNGDIFTAERVRSGPQLGPIATLEVTTTCGRHLLVYAAGSKEPMDGAMPFLGEEGFRDYLSGKKHAKVYNDPVPVTYGYCGTCHVYQGSEARRVSIFLTGRDAGNRAFVEKVPLPRRAGMVEFSIRWLYTAVTRAKEKATLFYDA